MTQLKDIGFQTEVVTGSELTTALSPVNSHISSTSNPHSVTKTQVGLSNVDNTSDLNKPISTATQSALDNKVDKIAGKGLSQEDYTTTEKSKLAGIESGAEVNNISDVNATDLTDGGDTTLHTHDGRYYTEGETDTLLLAKANDNEVVKLTGNQTNIAGEKTFLNNTRFLGNGIFGDETTITGLFFNIWRPNSTTIQIDSYTHGVGFRDLIINGNQLFLKSNGNVGIGTGNPDYKLDVNGAIGFNPGIGTTQTPVDNGDIVFQASSNTSLTVKMKGSDGVIRSTTLTLA